MGKIFKNTNQFNFLQDPASPQKGNKNKSEQTKRASFQPTKPLKSGVTQNQSRIYNAGDNGQSRSTYAGNFIGQKSGNTIFDSNKVQRMTKQKRSDEVVSQRKQEIRQNRDNYRKSNMSQIAESIKLSQTRRDSSVFSTSPQQGNATGPKFVNNQISIFDNGKSAFSRIPQKTTGQKIRDNARKQKQKDNSWRGLKPQTTVNSSLFDGIFNSMKKK